MKFEQTFRFTRWLTGDSPDVCGRAVNRTAARMRLNAKGSNTFSAFEFAFEFASESTNNQ